MYKRAKEYNPLNLLILFLQYNHFFIIYYLDYVKIKKKIIDVMGKKYFILFIKCK